MRGVKSGCPPAALRVRSWRGQNLFRVWQHLLGSVHPAASNAIVRRMDTVRPLPESRRALNLEGEAAWPHQVDRPSATALIGPYVDQS